ncbi:hypothetical protein N431DRAFT_505662 [Stipitochalara longipes BDJ]|nr:hypothetical protein N431DRAFT_505662 [Stipitochalara longipes BDJ]
MEIASSIRLDILTRVQTGHNNYKVPSWIPEGWSIDITKLPVPLHTYGSRKKFRAAGNTEARVKFTGTTKRQILVMTGVSVSEVNYVGNINEIEVVDTDTIKRQVRTVSSWFELLPPGKITTEDFEVFARTMICDWASDQGKPPPDRREFLQTLLGVFAMLLKLYYPGHTLPDPTAMGYWEAYLARNPDMVGAGGVLREDNKKVRIWRTWVQISSGCSWNRRFFLASDGLMGLSPALSAVGDLICIPPGCAIPIVLRKIEGTEPPGYTVVGAAYVDGFMYGKAMEMMEAGELKPQEYWIY